MTKGREIILHGGDKSPCKGCTERFPACSDRCPKDERGEYGYKAWKAELEEVKQKRKEWLDKANHSKWRGYYDYGLRKDNQ